jgi:DNA-binding transcriptional ArsR family regulator
MAGWGRILNHMVENTSEAEADAVFHALSHEIRRSMLGRLARRDLTVGELAEPLTISLAAASKHVKVLEGAGLVHRTVEGRLHRCRLVPGPLASVHAWLAFYEPFWNERLDRLGALVQQDDSTATPA